MKKIMTVLSVLLLTLLLFGCAKKEDEKVDNQKQKPQNQGIVAGKIEEYIQIELSGNTALFTFTVKNQTEKVKSFTIKNGMQYDFTITNEKGEEVYKDSKNKMFSQSIKNIELKQGQELTYHAKWNALEPGKYTVHFVWQGDTSVTAYSSFEIK